jgi:hypothetical protein
VRDPAQVLVKSPCRSAEGKATLFKRFDDVLARTSKAD